MLLPLKFIRKPTRSRFNLEPKPGIRNITFRLVHQMIYPHTFQSVLYLRERTKYRNKGVSKRSGITTHLIWNDA